MELLLMLVAGGLIIAAFGTAVSRSRNRESPSNNYHKKDDVIGGRGPALALDEAYRSGAGASFGRSYIGLDGINNDPFK